MSSRLVECILSYYSVSGIDGNYRSVFCIKPAAVADHPRRPRNHLEPKLLRAEVYTIIACIDFFRDYSAPISHLWVSRRLKSIQAQRDPPHRQTSFSSVSDKRATGGCWKGLLQICLGGASYGLLAGLFTASHAGVFSGARFSSLPTNACSREDNIPFPSLANHIVLSKFWKVDLDRKVI